MPEVEESLDRLVTCASSAEDVAARNEDNISRGLIELRKTYNAEIANLLRAVEADDRLRRHPDVAASLGAMISEMRKEMANMQARWRMHVIEADPAGYLAEIRRTNGKIRSTRDWARSTLGPIR
jgi:hypothetical protein